MYQHFIITYLHEAQHVSGDTPPIIRSLKLQWQPLVVRHSMSLTTSTNHTSNNLPRMKTQRLPVQFGLLMMGGVSLETCWVLY